MKKRLLINLCVWEPSPIESIGGGKTPNKGGLHSVVGRSTCTLAELGSAFAPGRYQQFGFLDHFTGTESLDFRKMFRAKMITTCEESRFVAQLDRGLKPGESPKSISRAHPVADGRLASTDEPSFRNRQENLAIPIGWDYQVSNSRYVRCSPSSIPEPSEVPETAHAQPDADSSMTRTILCAPSKRPLVTAKGWKYPEPICKAI